MVNYFLILNDANSKKVKVKNAPCSLIPSNYFGGSKKNGVNTK